MKTFVFHLDQNGGPNMELTPEEWRQSLQDFEMTLCRRFGGLTWHKARGLWLDPESKRVFDDVQKRYIIALNEYEYLREELRIMVTEFARDVAGQLALYWEFDGLAYVEPLKKPYDYANAMFDYEEGKLDVEQTIELFQYLVDNKLCYHLQGHYGRTADLLIEAGKITP